MGSGTTDSGHSCGNMSAAPVIGPTDAACPIRASGRNVMSVPTNDAAGEDFPATTEDRLRAAYEALRILGRQIRSMRGDD